MDTLDLVTKLANLGALPVLAYYILGELREQRREFRRGLGEMRELVEQLVKGLLDRTAPARAAPDLTRLGRLGERHNAPPLGVAIVGGERPSRRMRTMSDPPFADEDDGDDGSR